MTALGAAIYGGFFGLAALWLFVTADGADADDQGQRPDFSNSTNTWADSFGSSPFSATHSSRK
jgi:hypothetical protein